MTTRDTPITCEQVEKQLTAYAKKALSPAAQQALADHMATCDRCAQSLHELQTLETALRVEADGFRPQLSAEAQQRIQGKMYRRMRRALVRQRFFDVVQTGFTATAVLAITAVVAIFGYAWLQFLSNPAPGAQIEVVQTTAVVTTSAAPPPEPTATRPVTAVPLFGRSNGRVPSYWQHLQSPTPGQSPEAIAYTLVEAALAGDANRLQQLLVAMGDGLDEPTARLWLHFSRRCGEAVQASDFTYVPSPDSQQFNIIAVYITYQGNGAGQVKLRRINGDWFVTFSRIPGLNQCLIQQFDYPT